MLKVAIVGAGAIAKTHLESYLGITDVKIVALCDKFTFKAEELVSSYNLVALVYDDIERMLKNETPDVVSICLPPSLHASSSILAMNAGANVICEKPMAVSLEECDKMIEAAKANNVLLSVVCQNRFRTPIQKIKNLLSSGIAGQLYAAEIKSLWWRGDNYYDLYWRGTWKNEGGGCLLSHSVHYLDLMLYFLGMPKSVSATIMNLKHSNSECEDYSVALFDYDGIPVSFTSSLVDHGSEQKIHFDCENASFDLPWQVNSVKALENGFPENNAEMEEKINRFFNSIPELELEHHIAQISNFIAAINKKETLIGTAEEGRKVIEVAMAIYKASVTGSKVIFPLSADDEIYTKDGLNRLMPHFNEKKKNVENFSTNEISFARKY